MGGFEEVSSGGYQNIHIEKKAFKNSMHGKRARPYF